MKGQSLDLLRFLLAALGFGLLSASKALFFLSSRDARQRSRASRNKTFEYTRAGRQYSESARPWFAASEGGIFNSFCTIRRLLNQYHTGQKRKLYSVLLNLLIGGPVLYHIRGVTRMHRRPARLTNLHRCSTRTQAGIRFPKYRSSRFPPLWLLCLIAFPANGIWWLPARDAKRKMHCFVTHQKGGREFGKLIVTVAITAST